MFKNRVIDHIYNGDLSIPFNDDTLETPDRYNIVIAPYKRKHLKYRAYFLVIISFLSMKERREVWEETVGELIRSRKGMG